MPRKAALGAFLAEFDQLETEGLKRALRALSHDAAFADQSGDLLGLEARLTLLERLAGARALPPDVGAALDDLLSRARRLFEVRDAIERIPPSLAPGEVGAPPVIVRRRPGPPLGRAGEPDALWIPGIAQLRAYADEAIEVNASLCALAPQLTRA